MKRNVLITVITISILLSLKLTLTTQAEENTYTYIRDNLTIVSYSDQWSTTEQLSSLVDELYANTHGEELALLSYIFIKPNRLEGVAGLYYGKIQKVNDQVEMSTGCYIELYNGDGITSVDEYARVLSHEYGHHFMAYYMATKENSLPKDWLDSEYARIRGLHEYSQVTYIGEQETHYNHEWDVVEILAEDYVQVYGSDKAKKTMDFKDVSERLRQGLSDYYYDYRIYNLLPQENLDISLITDSKLAINYIQQLSGIYIEEEPIEMFVLKPRLDYVEAIYNNYNQYRFSWESHQDINKYTLIIYKIGDNDYPLPIGTKKFNQDLTIDGGTAVDLEKGIGIFQEFIGRFGVRLLAEDMNGYIHSSEEIEINFSEEVNHPRMFSDIKPEDWFYDDVMFCSMRDIFIGYDDGTFRAEQNISRDEFITTVLRGVKKIQFAPVASDYWFEEEGYLAQGNALKLNIENWTIEELKAPIKRQEMAEILRIALELNGVIDETSLAEPVNESLLTDIEESTYNNSIYLLETLGIIEGYADKSYRPQENASRGQVTKLLRYFHILSEDN